ncbi:hypothetical protein GALL_146560 [mine drainage metagenome]|uniref:Right handed beta helix domain-containing protein n=1 Tax=mine drainage metagenome TaxID=410659 RepID=A0A1J5S3Y0_9ZZZZ
MRNNETGGSKTHSLIAFVALFAISGLTTSCGGGLIPDGTSTSNGPSWAILPILHCTPQPAIGSIAKAQCDAVSTPYLSGNSVQYYCDCSGPNQSCAAAGSMQGSDTTGNGTQASPYQTINAARTWLNGGAHRTAALCQGGSFTPVGLGYNGISLAANSTCPIGSICNELREYPVGGTGAKPILNNPPKSGGNSYSMISTVNGGGGYRIMNLRLQGTQSPPDGFSRGFYLYYNSSLNSSTQPIHDITIENNDIVGFGIGVNDAMDSTSNITIIGNHFANNLSDGYLGVSSNLIINYNSFIDTGSDTIYDHAIYLSNQQIPVSNISIVGNYVTGISAGTMCNGTALSGHVAVTGLVVSGNVIAESPTAVGAGCWGISFTNTTLAAHPIFLANAVFSNNIIVNSGNLGIAISTCPSCVIENNLIIFQNNQAGGGISSPGTLARAQDMVENNVKIVNNTVYYDTNNTQGMPSGGVVVGLEGTGHIIANNTVMYAGSTHGSNKVNCFTYSLPLASYAFINNNNCYSNDSSAKWVFDGQTTFYLLAAWQAYAATAGLSGTGFDTVNASTYANPGWSFSTPLTIPALDETKTGAQLFAPYFTPVGLPLVGTGNAANAPATDITNAARSVSPSIGAYE